MVSDAEVAPEYIPPLLIALQVEPVLSSHWYVNPVPVADTENVTLSLGKTIWFAG